MKTVFRSLLFGALIGLVLGIILSEQRQKREAKAREDAFVNDPEIKAHIAEMKAHDVMEHLINQL
ncbi:MAG: hypothetical protein K8L97_13675 [Anaerolineae bacterium]|nr:hypothetical protein [Anaerolineae bacterium]